MQKFVGGRKFISGALVLTLLASTGVASAQERGDNPQVRRSWRNPPPAQPQPAPAAPEAPRAQTPPPAAEAPRAGRRDGARGGDERRGRDDQSRGDRDGRGGREGRDHDGRGRGDYDRGGRDWNDRGRDDRDRGRDGRNWQDGRDRNDGRNWQDRRHWDDTRRHQTRPRYDRRRYDPVWRSHQRYRGWAYRPPVGFYSHRWIYGETLPRSWWGTQYRILDWWAYGLPIPPIGFEWVRVGDDALLVDMYSGRVVQVAYDLFW